MTFTRVAWEKASCFSHLSLNSERALIIVLSTKREKCHALNLDWTGIELMGIQKEDARVILHHKQWLLTKEARAVLLIKVFFLKVATETK